MERKGERIPMTEERANEDGRTDEWSEALARRAAEAASTFWGYLGCELAGVAEGKAVVRLRVEPHHLNMLQIVHGGVIASLLDNAMGVAAMTALPGIDTVTAGLNVHFVAPAKGGLVTAEAEIVHRGRRTLTLTGTVADECGTVCARDGVVPRIGEQALSRRGD